MDTQFVQQRTHEQPLKMRRRKSLLEPSRVPFVALFGPPQGSLGGLLGTSCGHFGHNTAFLQLSKCKIKNCVLASAGASFLSPEGLGCGPSRLTLGLLKRSWAVLEGT